VIGLALAAIGFWLARRDSRAAWWLAGVGALALSLGVPLTGHPAADPLWQLAVPLMALHVLATAAWLGGLLVLMLVAVANGMSSELDNDRIVVRALVEAFSPLALVCVGTAIVTGGVVAALHLGSLTALFASRYGHVLLLKLFAFAGVAALGFANWRRVRPSLGESTGVERLRRSATAELTCAVLVLALTAVLGATPMPVTQSSGAHQASPASQAR
jgi:putative copper export protein